MKRIIVLFTICSCFYGMSFAQTAALNGGRIEPRQLTVQDTTSVILYSTEAASGGSAPIVYSWESSADALTWFSVPDATSESYESRPVSGGIYYRRKATSGDRIAYSNTVALSAVNTCRMLRAALRGFIVRTPFRNRPNITTVSMERVLIPIWSICMITHR